MAMQEIITPKPQIGRTRDLSWPNLRIQLTLDFAVSGLVTDDPVTFPTPEIMTVLFCRRPSGAGHHVQGSLRRHDVNSHGAHVKGGLSLLSRPRHEPAQRFHGVLQFGRCRREHRTRMVRADNGQAVEDALAWMPTIQVPARTPAWSDVRS